tara:strand:- start:2939 stop:3172 length:234 start_codon:yes stop_codon:yes gene_type:complete
MIRIAWCDKSRHKYYEGSWYRKTDKTIKMFKCWVNMENIKRPNEYYWIEIREDGKVKNYVEMMGDNIERDYVELFIS